jgi:RNA polymerase-binding transcription factor
MTADELDLVAIERDLREHHAVVHAKIEALAAAPEQTSGISFGKRVGDGTTEAVSRLTDVGAGEKLLLMAERVDRALAKLDDGTYGVCDSCGKPILPARLRVAPESVRCIDCARG